MDNLGSHGNPASARNQQSDGDNDNPAISAERGSAESSEGTGLVGKMDDLHLQNPTRGLDLSDDLHPGDKLLAVASSLGVEVEDAAFAEYMDQHDSLRHLRQVFHYPKMKNLATVDLRLVDPEEDCVYFGGSSMGLCAHSVKQHMDGMLRQWATIGSQGYERGDTPFFHCDVAVARDMAKLVGAKEVEVAIMNGLTVNLHLQLVSFYNPTPTRHKILCESGAFHADMFTFQSQIRFHGYDPEKSLICLGPREGEPTLRTEDILQKIEEEGDSIAVICFPGVQYYTGQLFDIPAITAAGHKKGCYVGWDVSHAAGNVELFLHDWNVDFACWCTYKYFNGGPGNVAGFFLHERHKDSYQKMPRFLGQWGCRFSSWFDPEYQADVSPGAYGYRLTIPPGLLFAPLKASMEVFQQTSMKDLAAKSRLLTGYLELLVSRKYQKQPGGKTENKGDNQSCVEFLTPHDPKQRGASLSLKLHKDVLEKVYTEISKRGVVCEKWPPHVIRMAPAPLYCSFQDIHRFMKYFTQAMEAATAAPAN